MADRNIVCLPRLHGERDADDVGLHLLGGGCFGIEGDDLGAGERFRQSIELLRRVDHANRDGWLRLRDDHGPGLLVPEHRELLGGAGLRTGAAPFGAGRRGSLLAGEPAQGLDQGTEFE